MSEIFISSGFWSSSQLLLSFCFETPHLTALISTIVICQPNTVITLTRSASCVIRFYLHSKLAEPKKGRIALAADCKSHSPPHTCYCHDRAQQLGNGDESEAELTRMKLSHLASTKFSENGLPNEDGCRQFPLYSKFPFSLFVMTNGEERGVFFRGGAVMFSSCQ